MPTLRQLEYLVALSETGHFRHAAERLNATQPTLSEQIKALETRLGAQLVERSRGGVLLTPLGTEVVRIARRMLADADDIRTLATTDAGTLAGVLRLGLPHTIGPYLLPLLIPTLKAAYPNLKLYVREELPHNLARSLADGHHDLILTLLPLKDAGLASAALFEEPLSLAVSNAHRLADCQTAKLSDLAGEDVLALGEGYQLHDVVVSLCRDAEARLRLDYEGTSLDTLREMVAMDLGVTFLPGLYVRAIAHADHNIRIIPFQGRRLQRPVGLAWRVTSARQSVYASLAALLRETIADHWPDLTVLQDT